VRESNDTKSGLFDQLQSSEMHVKEGHTLRIVCAANRGQSTMAWTFTPRYSKIPIKIHNVTNQLLYVNVSVEKHEGTYVCAVGDDKQTYHVTVLTPPVFHGESKSFETSVLAPVMFTYNVTGNPPPKVVWYRNGVEIENSYLVYHVNSTLKINSIDPEDEGVYQCEARNEADTIMTSFYVAVRDRLRYKYNNKRAESVRCYPLDISSLYVEFVAQERYKFVTYFLATQNPHTWSSKVEMTITNNSFKISDNIEPFRNYAVFMRGFKQGESKESIFIPHYHGLFQLFSVLDLTLSPSFKESYQARRISAEVMCASQGCKCCIEIEK
jgi:hypothetical protein